MKNPAARKFWIRNDGNHNFVTIRALILLIFFGVNAATIFIHKTIIYTQLQAWKFAFLQLFHCIYVKQWNTRSEKTVKCWAAGNEVEGKKIFLRLLWYIDKSADYSFRRINSKTKQPHQEKYKHHFECITHASNKFYSWNLLS